MEVVQEEVWVVQEEVGVVQENGENGVKCKKCGISLSQFCEYEKLENLLQMW